MARRRGQKAVRWRWAERLVNARLARGIRDSFADHSEPNLPAGRQTPGQWPVLLLGLIVVLATFATTAEPARQAGEVLPFRERVPLINSVLTDRLDHILPALMRETGLDMWLVINREYAEDPVYLSLVPEPVFRARRTTMLLFFDRGKEEGVERLTVSRYPLGDTYASAWEGGSDADQWARLAALIKQRKPERIGVNTSADWGVADGLTSGLNQRLQAALAPEYRERLVSGQNLVIRWLETRSEAELELYPHIVALARGVIAEAFSSAQITPGKTTPDDVAWFIRQRFEELNLRPWFQPDVNYQRRGTGGEESAIFGHTEGVIEAGDILHTDVGICYLRLCTDTQEMAYVLRKGEEAVPKGLVAALADGNRWQDLLTSRFRAGRTGNEILAAARSAASSQGLTHAIYTHPLGFFGHAPGPTIGMWDNQGPTPVRGDWPLYDSTAYAIEGNVRVALPEWDGQAVQIKLEQDAVFRAGTVEYIAGRQTRWHVVR